MMKHENRSFLRITMLLAVVLALAGIVVVGNMLVTAAPTAVSTNAPMAAPAMAPVPTATCNLVGTERTCDLWAKEGTMTLPDGSPVPIWGFTDNISGTAGVPGPTLVVNEGETVVVNFTNEISGEMVSLSFGSNFMVPDLTGVALGQTATYTFTASAPGTYKYEAGLTQNGARQVMMGLFGALIVRPATNPLGQAYNDPASAFNQEVLMVYHEVDPAFNASPNTFQLTQFQPSYWFINGRAYSQTEKIIAAPGETLLMRYLNGGVEQRSVSILGLHQTVLSTDGSMYPYAFDVVAETMPAGSTMDTIVTMPNPAMDLQQYPIFNTSFQQLHNAGALGTDGKVAMGGMISFIEINAGTPPVAAGPLVTTAAVSPTVTAGTTDVDMMFTLDSTTTSGLGITSWEYYLNDFDGTPEGTGLTSGTTTEAITTTIPAAAFSALPAGDVTVYIRGFDSAGTPGPVNSVILDLVTEGPVISGLSLYSSPANGTQPVTLLGTADDRIVGSLNVVQAQYFIDTLGAPGTGTDMTLTPSPVASISASIPAAAIAALSEGPHTIYVMAVDELGNWGQPSTIVLDVDKTGPASTGTYLWPNPNNGTQSVNSSANGVRLEINTTDASRIARAEGFLGTVGTDGTGFPLIARDGLYDETSEAAYTNIPLSTVRQMADGPNVIYFHAQDAAGNWGPISSMTLHIDQTGPAVANVAANVTNTNGRVGITVTADATDPANGTDPGSAILTAEYFVNNDPGAGFGTPMDPVDGIFDSATEALTVNIPVGRWPDGTYTIYVRAQDAALNWGDAGSVTVQVTGNNVGVLFNDNFETANFVMWNEVMGDVAITPQAALAGDLGLQANLFGLAPAYVRGSVVAAMEQGSYDINFKFNPNGSDPAGTEQQIFVANDVNGQPVFGLYYEINQNGDPEVQGFVMQGGLPVVGPSGHLSGGAQKITLRWDADAGALTVLIDGMEVGKQDGGMTNASVTEVVLGPSNGLAVGASGTQYYDEFVISPTTFTIYMPVIFQK